MKRGKWSDSEVDFLRENFETMSYSELSLSLNRNKNNVRAKALHLGLRRYEQNDVTRLIMPLSPAGLLRSPCWNNEDEIRQSLSPTYSHTELTGWELETYLNLENGTNRTM